MQGDPTSVLVCSRRWEALFQARAHKSDSSAQGPGTGLSPESPVSSCCGRGFGYGRRTYSLRAPQHTVCFRRPRSVRPSATSPPHPRDGIH
jgi:hypothetical protein